MARTDQPRQGRDPKAVSGFTDHPYLALTVDARWIGEGPRALAGLFLDVALRRRDLSPRRVVGEFGQRWVSAGMRTNREETVLSDLAELAPGEHGGRALVPVGPRSAVDDPGRNKERGGDPEVAQHGNCVVEVVVIAIVEGHAHIPTRRSFLQQVERLMQQHGLAP